mmetsp:Transcript_2458/g.6311  ORF Transcript_2458/g.6311 Transcript_2458/m.6311 type:complete len:240 (-) Transcript_2458:370-1089(-)
MPTIPQLMPQPHAPSTQSNVAQPSGAGAVGVGAAGADAAGTVAAAADDDDDGNPAKGSNPLPAAAPAGKPADAGGPPQGPCVRGSAAACAGWAAGTAGTPGGGASLKPCPSGAMIVGADGPGAPAALPPSPALALGLKLTWMVCPALSPRSPWCAYSAATSLSAAACPAWGACRPPAAPDAPGSSPPDAPTCAAARDRSTNFSWRISASLKSNASPLWSNPMPRNAWRLVARSSTRSTK